MDIMPFIKNFSFKKNKNTLFIILLIGVLMLVCSKSLFASEKPKNDKKANETAVSSADSAEKRLSAMLGKISGAGKT